MGSGMALARLGRWVASAGLIVSGALAHAGYEQGRDAYQRRDFPRALAEFVPAASADPRADLPPQAQTPTSPGDPYADAEPSRPRRPQTTWYYGFSYGYGWGPYWGWYAPFWGPPWPYAGWGWGYPRYGCCPGGGAQFGVIIRP
jgi:hypothetical protein